jgi:dihydroxy-acid dehydratase
MYAAGYKAEDFGKPIVTVAAPYLSYHMCNQKFRELADIVGGMCSAVCEPHRALDAVEAHGSKPFISHQPVISDGQTMGSDGMRFALAHQEPAADMRSYSLVSRDMIADCIELMHEV